VAAKLARFSWLPGGLAAVLVLSIGRWVAPASFAPAEWGLYDRVLRSSSALPDQDIVIISIDDASIQKLGAWPWPRDVHASLVDKLHDDGARVIAFTTQFDTSQSSDEETEHLRAVLALLESSNLGSSEQAQQLRALLSGRGSEDADAHLIQSIANHGNVVLPVTVTSDAQTPNAAALPDQLLATASVPSSDARPFSVEQAPSSEYLKAASAIGHSYQPSDFDQVVRRDLTGIPLANGALPSLATAIAARALEVSPHEIAYGVNQRLVIGNVAPQVDAGWQALPQYFPDSGPRAFKRIAYWQILAGEVGREELAGKIAIVGFVDGTAAPVATPVSRSSSTAVATASAVSSLMHASVYTQSRLSAIVEVGCSAIVVLFAAFSVPAAGVLIGGLATVLVIAALIVGEIGVLSSLHVWARLVLCCIAAVAGFGLYLVGELIRRANVGPAAHQDSAANLRTLGQTFQKQGQLDLAFETYRRCPLDNATMELLYYLGLDFERRRQTQKAGAVYTYIASRDPNYRDLRARRARTQEPPAPPITRNLAQPAAPAPAPTRPVVDEDFEHDYRDERPPARTLGRYEIERELGKGAMGIVYLGRDPKINRVVAIKAIPLAEEFEEQDLAEARARFFREAEMAGRLNHPAIVTVYDAGEDQGLAYIAMEYLRGQHLSHSTDPNRLLPPKTVMLLVARVAEALHYAHRQNVVHRDIKPANIMFNPDTDELKITDFGIARLTDTSRTKTGIVLGTPSFMSPEQLEGRPLDGRSDQFALGVSLYQLLCGQLPFRAESMPRLMQKIATEPHSPARQVRPELPECIDAILGRTLQKNADDRYVNCAEMALALRECAASMEPAASDGPKHEWLIP
jgi:CHASE2 domain-containing sensor protein/predicted Ser/Thr protein kinase